MEPCKPSLVGIPEKLLNRITEQIDLKSLYNLHKSCHHLRDHVSRTKLPNLYKKLSFTVEHQNITVLHHHNGELITVVYRNHASGCLVEVDDNINLLEDEDYVAVFLHDFGLILRNQLGKLDELEMKQGIEGLVKLDENQFPRILQAIQFILQTRIIQIQVEKLILYGKNQDQIMQILPYMAPEALKYIHLGYPSGGRFDLPLEMEQIRNTAQWKVADQVECHRGIQPYAIAHFGHFSRVHVALHSVRNQDLVAVKLTFLLSPTLQYLHLHYPSGDSLLLLETLGRPYMSIPTYSDDSPQKWFYRFPIANEILEIYHPTFNNFIEFKRIQEDDVPQGVTVVDP